MAEGNLTARTGRHEARIMEGETSFRLAILVVLVANLSVVVYHRLKARTGEKLDRRQEGLSLAIALRLSGLALWTALLAYLVYPAAMAWSQLALPDGVRWAGGVLGMAAAGLMYWTLSSLGKNLTDTVVRRQGATLVTAGPYRWVRHPFYLTVGCLFLAVAVLSASWLLALCGGIALALLALRTPKEEQKLVEGFGNAYREYMARTGRFLPRFGRR
jgi:protein-S-isoprenylcysteine O-methyltransferase Ste14